MKKVILVVGMVFATSSLVNANTNGIINNKAEIIETDRCASMADEAATYVSLMGGDYWTAWFGAYGSCIELERAQ
ncbi:exported hypothetical protein [Tenacibaculum sediminilitoris]|uniref:hypothetical protein n=1 Tax=Tenacibaculum sediminilitoris TaxID=1820334 RepID=UPI0038962FC8